MHQSLSKPAEAPARWRFDLTLAALRRFQRAYDQARAAGADLPAFRLVLDDGRVCDFGVAGRPGPGFEPAFTLTLRNRAGRAALAALDETRFAIAYMRGDVDLDGDVKALLGLRALAADHHPLRALWSKLLHARLFGQVKSDEKWIAEHYDEHADFYLLFLDRRRCYSHGIFASPDEALDDAILRKLDFALDAVGARPGDRILDIGAGWGAMTEHAGRRGIETTSLTISKASEEYVEKVIADNDLPCRVVREHFLEHRAERPYDAIVNLGVTEHLPDYAATLQQYLRLLAPRGRVYLDACSSRVKFPFSSFIYRFIFPGNATPLCLHEYLAEVAKTPFEVVAVHNDRESYRLTCLHWVKNLERHRAEIAGRWGEHLFRRFQLYLWGCVDVFERDEIGAYRLVLQLPG